MITITLFVAGSLGWFFSTLAGGGSPLILLPVLGWFFDATVIPPVLTTGMLFGNLQRMGLYWKEIDWPSTWWYMPGAIVGSTLGAFVFAHIQLKWLPLVLGIFLVFSSVSQLFQQNNPFFKIRTWYFMPAGLIYAFLSGLVGSTGPMLNLFYINYGLVKEPMIATKSVHMVAVHVAKLIAYAAFGVLHIPFLGYGLLLGLAAWPGNWLGQKVLERMSIDQFKQVVMLFVSISGLLLIWRERGLVF
ncbi:sulfite exporter TauE/SafE family protein [Pannus brasiliensis CCIBt3594]|uniref:Probable membrane transporter protein n=1 Tax=Pannus brasiliensis CCIBt3594 TaxID=1427578 RepID=A0AAW9QCZ6_9CHRO